MSRIIYDQYGIATITSKIEHLNNLIYFNCRLLNIRNPEIYYFEQGKDFFVLNDRYCNTISTDRRDMGYAVKMIRFIPKEYCIYINISLLDNMIMAYVHIIRTIREMFQLKQIIYFQRNRKLDINEYDARQWHYCYTSQHFERSDLNDIPTEMDKNSFSLVLMRYLFKIELSYKVRDEKRFLNRIDEIQNKYDEDKVRMLFREFEVENPKVFMMYY